MPASRLTDQSVYTSSNREVGTIDSVLSDRNGENFATISLDDSLNAGDRTVIVPLANLSRQNGRLVLNNYRISEVKRLPNFSNDGRYQEARDDQRVRISGYDTAGIGADQRDPSRIVVQQTAPRVSVDQTAPRVTVRQAQPNVTVRQPQPQIIVRQAPPTITVDQPQPEIIVRMPRPDVSVAQARPQVSVDMPQPRVQVERPQQQPQVQVQRAQPRVVLQAANEKPEVNVQQQGQPKVQYERQGEPRVVYRQAQGNPTIRYERMADANDRAADNATNNAQAARSDATANQQRATAARQSGNQQATNQAGGNDVDRTAAGNANVSAQALSVATLKGMNVYNARGEDLGGVDRVIVNPSTRRQYLVLESGGFLGIGADHVALPLERFWVEGDRLVIRGVTEDDIDQMNDWKTDVANYRTLSDNEVAQVQD